MDDDWAYVNDTVDKYPRYKGRYVDRNRLEELAGQLLPPHLGDGKLSLKNNAKRVVMSLRVMKDGNAEEGSSLLMNSPETTNSYSSNGTTTVQDDPSDIRDFVEAFRFEVEKVEGFVREELEKLHERFETLMSHIQSLRKVNSKVVVEEQVTPEFVEIYREAHYLCNFEIGNYTSFVMVLHHNQVSGRFWKNERGWLGPVLSRKVLEKTEFSRTVAIRQLIREVRDTFAENFLRGNYQAAHFTLLKKRREKIDWETVMVGVWSGVCLQSLLWTLYVLAFDPVVHVTIAANIGARMVFRVTGLALLMFWGMATQFALWREFRVNFPLIFGIPAQRLPLTGKMFLIAARLSVIYLLSMIGFIKLMESHTYSIYAAYIPMGVLGLFVGLAVSVWYRFVFAPRTRLVGFTSSCFTAAYGALLFLTGTSEKGFLIAYVSDYLTSSSKILVDCAKLACRMFSSNQSFSQTMVQGDPYCDDSPTMVHVVAPIIMCWPLWLRLGQNLYRLYVTRHKFPFLINAIKYGMAHTIVIFSALHPELLDFTSPDNHISLTARLAFLMIFTLTTFGTFFWDVLVDWGLGKPQFKGLRSRLMFNNTSWYYAAIVADLFLRFLWTINLLALPKNQVPMILTDTGTLCLEVFRRTFWGLFRVENEHLSNTRMYRNVNFVPLYFDTPLASQEPCREKHSAFYLVVIEIAIFLVILGALAIVAISF